MKKFQSYDQFEAEWKKESIHEIDLDKVKAKVIGPADNDRKMLVNKRKMTLVIAMVVFTLCLGTVVMAVYNGWQLKNKQGDILLNYAKGEMTEMNRLVRGMNARLEFYEAEDEALESLAPGEMAYFLVVKEYEISKYLPVLQREEKITDLDKLKNITITKFKLPEYLPNGYKFEYGIVTFKAEGEDAIDKEALYNEAKKTGRGYIIKKGKLTKEANQVRLIYVNKDGYKLNISVNSDNDRKLFGYDHEIVETLAASHREVLHIKSKWGEIESYLFVDEGSAPNLIYGITNSGINESRMYGKGNLPLPKEEAIKMIESFK